MPDTIVSSTVTHNSIKDLPTQIAICSLTPAWQGYYMELIPLNGADKARCHPCQHTSYIWGNVRTLWLKEILLLPNTDWQQKCFMAVFSALMTVTASAIFVRAAAKKGQEIDCHSALAILQKEPRSEGCLGSLREGRWGSRGEQHRLKTLPTYAWLWESDECGSFLICPSVRKL